MFITKLNESGFYWRAMFTCAVLASFMLLSTTVEANGGPFESRCKNLALFDLQIPVGEDVDSVRMVGSEVRAPEEAGDPPLHCAVTFEVDIDETQEWRMTSTHFFPEEFSGRFIHTGGGGVWSGWDGIANSVYLAQGIPHAEMNNDNLQNGALSWDYNPNDEADQALSRDGVHLSTVVGRQLVEEFYGAPADHSYYFGCSTGGMQGLQSALYHPETFDGISANAPVFYAQIIATAWEMWRKQLDTDSVFLDPFGNTDVLDAVLARCDGLDGVMDGVIDRPEQCNVALGKLAGEVGLSQTDQKLLQEYSSPSKVMGTTSQGAVQFWAQGFPIFNLWHGSAFIADVMGYRTWALLDPSYDPADNFNYDRWLPAFLAFDFDDQSYYDQLAELSVSVKGGQYARTLHAFDDEGGKLIVWHTWPDQILPIGQTIDWANFQAAQDSNIRDHMRFFHKTAGGHCDPHNGAALRDALFAWVEEGEAPESLPLDTPGSNRPACEYPLVPRLVDAELDEWECIKTMVDGEDRP